MYRRCMKSSEKVRFVRNTFQGALFLHLYLTDLLQMRGRRMSCTSKCEFRSKYAEIFLNCGVRKQEMAFSKAQTQAIMHKDGPMMVLAGPGSGKTTVITHRVQYLTKEYGIDPGDILVITFTRAAAEEMRERYEALTGGGSRVTFGTFHSIFFRILKLAYRYTADNIVREEQQMQFVRELAQAGGLEPEDENEFAASILSEISSVKGERIALEHYYSKNCPDAVFRQLYAGYEEKMRRAGLIDFDDMMVLCLELFTERKDILSAWQRRYPGVKSVTIVSDDGTLADALSTSLFVMGKEKALDYWREHKNEFDTVLVEDNGDITITGGLEKIFKSNFKFDTVK